MSEPETARKFAHPSQVTVVHAPSDEGRKGTLYLERAVERLREDGLPINYRKLVGLSRTELRDVLRASHIMVDQLLVGYYGNALIEAVASGALGVVNIKVPHDPVALHVASASAGTIEAELRTLTLSILRGNPAIADRVRDAAAFFREKHAPDAVFRTLASATS